jgi:DNA invertase Pin-like site-specific DNA recombinase
MKPYVAYYRVSTKQQGASGLGLQAQRHSVAQFIGSDILLAEYTEVESGKHDKRPQLQAALDFAKRHDATLVIAKLDRLSRNAGFIFALRDARVNFVCADMPEANTLTIGIFAVLAQYERELISQRIVAALAAKKAQGFKLGNPENLTYNDRVKGATVRKEQSREGSKQAAQVAKLLREKGLTLRAIAEELHKTGFRTPKGKEFRPTSVLRLVK